MKTFFLRRERECGREREQRNGRIRRLGSPNIMYMPMMIPMVISVPMPMTSPFIRSPYIRPRFIRALFPWLLRPPFLGANRGGNHGRARRNIRRTNQWKRCRCRCRCRYRWFYSSQLSFSLIKIKRIHFYNQIFILNFIFFCTLSFIWG